MMRVSTSTREWISRRRELDGRSIGFVPTMGALHEGHASLVRRARAENDIVVVSIFVNPSQFNDPKDLERYPRTPETDLDLLASLGVDDVFAPPIGDLYANGYSFRVEAPGVAGEMEGVHRPGFFEGVMTIVLKLLNLVRAERAYFGEKDFQQLRVITDMAGDFFIPTEIVPCPTVREPSGLAMSSRNALLSEPGRRRAAAFYRILTRAVSPEEARALLEREGFRVDYIEEHWGRRFGAVFLENIRLIDNVPLCEVVRPAEGLSLAIHGA
jgi:pantoate--beta-alanine ligase